MDWSDRRFDFAMDTTPTKSVSVLLHEHAVMLHTMRMMRLTLLNGQIDQARHALDALHKQHAAHIAAEEAQWIPRISAGARWQPKVYLAEHAKLGEMLLDWRHRLAALDHKITDAAARLGLLDASLPLQHLLEHHFEREEKGMFADASR